MTLGEQLDKAELVRYEDATQLVYAWFGGESRIVHIYDDTGFEADCWTVGGDNNIRLDLNEVNDSIERHIARNKGDEAW
jgi:hypothetical protein